jgi:hypothetical protein
LAADVGESLTGRKFTLRLFPLAQMELGAVEDRHVTAARLESRLLYGSYPEVVTGQDNQFKKRYLLELVNSYVFKDVLQMEGLRNADKLTRLLQLLAFQIGREVSTTELGSQLAMSKNTLERYLDLLEKVFVVYHRTGFSRNLRKEITKSRRYYFYDNDIRNALIQNFALLTMRDDVGVLWENYLCVERLKYLDYCLQGANTYFWRTYDRQEIDLVEERGGRIHGYEMKWKPKKMSAPPSWTRAYPEATYSGVGRDNYLPFITGSSATVVPD